MDISVNFNEKRLSPEKEAAIELAKKYEHVFENGTYKVTFRKNSADLIRLLEFCRNWKTACVMVDNKGKNVSLVLDVLYCSSINDCSSVCDKAITDYISLLTSISEGIEGNDTDNIEVEWLLETLLSLDSFERQEDGSFSVDKEKLKKEIEREYSIPIHICNNFDKAKIFSQVDALPEKFKLPENIGKKHESDFFDADTIEELKEKAEIVAPIIAKSIAKELDKVIIANFGPENDAKSCVKKGDSLFELQRFDESLDCFTKALIMDPTNAEIWYKKGELLEIGFEKYGEAIPAYEKALELDPSMIFALQCKGVCLDSLGKNEEAIEAYETVIGLYRKRLDQNPTDCETKENLETVRENLSALKS